MFFIPEFILQLIFLQYSSSLLFGPLSSCWFCYSLHSHLFCYVLFASPSLLPIGYWLEPGTLHEPGRLCHLAYMGTNSVSWSLASVHMSSFPSSTRGPWKVLSTIREPQVPQCELVKENETPRTGVGVSENRPPPVPLCL